MDSLSILQLVVSYWRVDVGIAVTGATLITIVSLCVHLLNRRALAHRNMAWLEITPPATIAKTPGATEHLFAVIHGSHATRSVKESLLGRIPVMSFEITSTKRDGIRYLVQMESSRLVSVQKTIAAYIPEAKVTKVDLPATDSRASVIEFHQDKHYVLPITAATSADQHDPLSYVTNAMTKLEDGEQLTLQLVLTPVNLREARHLSHRILSNEDILRRVQRGRLAFLPTLFEGLGSMAIGAAALTGEAFAGAAYGHTRPTPKTSELQQQAQILQRQKPARTISSFERELMESMHQKLTKPLFLVNLRVMVVSQAPKNHASALRSAVDAYSMPPYQQLRMNMRLPGVNSYRNRLAERRLPSLTRRQSLILSSTEVASLYHFPSSRISQTDNLITSLSRTLPAPVSMKSGRKLALLIGENQHHDTRTPIGLTESERERHVYIIGGTGNGKTTLLTYGIVQDIQNGNGVAVVDPHGDLAETLLRYIPEERIKDVIYMNPDDLSYPIGVNLLELPEGLEGDDILREKDRITESVISIMRKLFSDDDSGGHRVEYVLRNTIQTALTLEHPTLFTIFELLNNPRFRRSVTKTLEDENLKHFWINELGKAGDYQKVKMVAGITAKIGRFLFSASAKRILEQEKSTINFDDILDGKILICNFSKGVLGEDTSALFGTMILAKLQLASLRRAQTNASLRRPFYLYVDEFQNFATIGFVQMLSEARKYKLFLTMAEQSTSQQDKQRLVDIILANVGTVICFRSGSPADERLVLPLFSPYIEQGEIANLPAYSYYARIAAVHSQEPMSGVTVLLQDEGSTVIAEQVRVFSRKTYGRRYEADQPPTVPQVTPSVQAALNKKQTETYEAISTIHTEYRT